MILHFPNLKTLRLALSSGAVPAGVAAAPVDAAIGKEGDVLAQPRGRLTAEAKKKLAALGVTAKRGAAGDSEKFCCWQQLLPVERSTGEVQLGDKSVVLFQLADVQLPELVVGSAHRNAHIICQAARGE